MLGFSTTVAVLAGVVLAAPPLVAEPASYVNPLIGSTNLGNTYPGAATPFGMLAWSPQTSRGNQLSTPAPGGVPDARCEPPLKLRYGYERPKRALASATQRLFASPASASHFSTATL